MGDLPEPEFNFDDLDDEVIPGPVVVPAIKPAPDPVVIDIEPVLSLTTSLFDMQASETPAIPEKKEDPVNTNDEVVPENIEEEKAPAPAVVEVEDEEEEEEDPDLPGTEKKEDAPIVNPFETDPYEWDKCTITIVYVWNVDDMVSVSVRNHQDEPIIKMFPVKEVPLENALFNGMKILRGTFKKCPITVTIAILPIQGTDERQVVITERVNNDTPILNYTKLTALELPAPIMALLEELKVALPMRAFKASERWVKKQKEEQDKKDKEAKRKKTIASKYTAPTAKPVTPTAPAAATSAKLKPPEPPKPEQYSLF